jgi:hypothetical protein
MRRYPFRQRHFYAGFYLAGEDETGTWCQTTSGFYPGGLPEAMRDMTRRAADRSGASRAQIIDVDFEAGEHRIAWSWTREGGDDGGDGSD